jgi:hypothetical protein
LTLLLLQISYFDTLTQLPAKEGILLEGLGSLSYLWVCAITGNLCSAAAQPGYTDHIQVIIALAKIVTAR